MLTVRDELIPPPDLPSALHDAFNAFCERLRLSGCELSELDAVAIAQSVQAAAALSRARLEADGVPLVCESRANGAVIHAVHKAVLQAEANLRSWLKLLPRATGRPSPPPHASPAAVAPVAAAGGDAAGDAVPVAVAGEGEPSERVLRLRAIIAKFVSAGGADAGGVAGDDAGGVAVSGTVDAGGVGADAAGVAGDGVGDAGGGAAVGDAGG